MGGPPMGGMPPGMGGPPMGGMPPGMPPGGMPPGGMPGRPMMGGPVMMGGGGTSKAKMILGGIIAVLVVIGGIAFAVYSSGHTSLHFVNAAGPGAMTISVDGVDVSKNLQYSPTENRSAVDTETITSGKHKIEAKDASGKVVDTQTIEFDGWLADYVYAPAHSPKVCFTLQTDAYGSARVANPFTPLDPTKTLWKMPKSVDYWFQDTPGSVNLDKKQSGTTKTALRQHTCGDPNFQN